jgi:hypothetical protein
MVDVAVDAVLKLVADEGKRNCTRGRSGRELHLTKHGGRRMDLRWRRDGSDGEHADPRHRETGDADERLRERISTPMLFWSKAHH